MLVPVYTICRQILEGAGGGFVAGMISLPLLSITVFDEGLLFTLLCKEAGVSEGTRGRWVRDYQESGDHLTIKWRVLF